MSRLARSSRGILAAMDPSYIVFSNPDGGLGLKTKTAGAARQRIDGLLAACAEAPVLRSLELEVAEPGPAALVQSVIDTPGSADGRGPPPADLIGERRR